MIATIPRALLHSPPKTESDPTLIGENRGLRAVSNAVRMVAAVDSTVLIEGETGTGKELIARAIHDRSPRSGAPYVKVNCAAIPSALLESELFGHERGAFTGACTQTTGRFQLADRGTLFLDEIGDLPLDLQPKLLRVLQSQEFERLGSTTTIRTDVRIVAATNLNLGEMVKARQFRADLFYRLNVFPIHVPPLRERSQDIPELVWHFVHVHARRMNRDIRVISDPVMEIIQTHHWPGNIRELQNFIERAVILSPGPFLCPSLGEIGAIAQPHSSHGTRTLQEAERDHILEVLAQTRGVVGGNNGAATRLGIPRTTLLYRMHKLGIDPANLTQS